MTPNRVLLLAIAFWATGALVTLSLSLNGLLAKAAAPRFHADASRAPWLRFACFGGGVALGVAQAALIFVPLAASEARRILGLSVRARAVDFFPRCKLLGVLGVALSCALVDRLTEAYYASVLVFVALLAAVGVSLAAGAARLSLGLCLSGDHRAALLKRVRVALPPLLEEEGEQRASDLAAGVSPAADASSPAADASPAAAAAPPAAAASPAAAWPASSRELGPGTRDWLRDEGGGDADPAPAVWPASARDLSSTTRSWLRDDGGAAAPQGETEQGDDAGV